MHLHVLYPSFVLEAIWDFTPEENKRLSELAWKVSDANENTEKTHAQNSGAYFTKHRFNLLEDYWEEPVVQKFAMYADRFARDYLRAAYNNDMQHPIKLMAEPFCQNTQMGTKGIMMHAHQGKPLLVTYYPSVKIEKAEAPLVGNMGANGEIDFYDPTGLGKRWWANKHPGHHTGSVFRLAVQEGTALAFEGQIPHAGCPFTGEERVCIPVICYPQLPHKNGGKTLDELAHK